GADAWSKLLKITIPYIKPTVLSTVLLRIIWVMNFPDIIYGTTRGGPGGATSILPVQMINIVYYQNNFGKASALGMIITMMLLLFTIFYLLIFEKGDFEV
ncbi:MAG: carbohydrate ABC transporter permease, partial [Pseudothermotoga sp.]